MAAVPVHGVVLDARGRPLAGARVGWARGPAGVALPDVMALSDAQGRFSLSAPLPGDYELACHPDDGGGVTMPVRVGRVAITVTVVAAP